VFADTDNDGLPDTRLPDSKTMPDLEDVRHANAAVLAATNPQQLDAALAELVAAVAAARSKLDARR
jgi:hypothetical protein